MSTLTDFTNEGLESSPDQAQKRMIVQHSLGCDPDTFLPQPFLMWFWMRFADVPQESLVDGINGHFLWGTRIYWKKPLTSETLSLISADFFPVVLAFLDSFFDLCPGS
jgi:hypothetical protein